MALLNATLWNDIQIAGGQDERRYPALGALNAVADSTPAVDYISPTALEALRTISSDRDVQIPVIKDGSVTVNTTPGYEYIPTNLSESDQYTFSTYDVFSGFRHFPSIYANNAIDEQFDRETKMKKIAHEMGKSVETILLTVLDARKTQVLSNTTQVSQGDGTFTFSTVSDTLTISKNAQKETMFFYMEQLMESNDVGGMYRFVGSRGAFATQIAEYLKYGANNDQNKQALGIPMDMLYTTSQLSAGSDVFTGFAFRDGAIGIVENFPYNFREGVEFAGKTWSVTDMPLPFCRMRANVYTNTEATNATALVTSGTDSNSKMTHFEEMAVWLRFTVVYRYNSSLSTRVNDIVKIVGATS